MLEWIDKDLCAWGRWAIRQASAGVGYPSTSPMFRDYRSSEVYRSIEPVGVLGQQDYELIDGAVNKLPSVLRVICIEHYQHSKGWADSVRRLGINKQALSTYLDRAHRQLADLLSEHKKN